MSGLRVAAFHQKLMSVVNFASLSDGISVTAHFRLLAANFCCSLATLDYQSRFRLGKIGKHVGFIEC